MCVGYAQGKISVYLVSLDGGPAYDDDKPRHSFMRMASDMGMVESPAVHQEMCRS